MALSLMDILEREASSMEVRMAKALPATTHEEQRARDLMILLHTALFIIHNDERHSTEELRMFAGQVLQMTRPIKQ